MIDSFQFSILNKKRGMLLCILYKMLIKSMHKRCILFTFSIIPHIFAIFIVIIA